LGIWAIIIEHMTYPDVYACGVRWWQSGRSSKV